MVGNKLDLINLEVGAGGGGMMLIWSPSGINMNPFGS